LQLFEELTPFTLSTDVKRISNVVLKNARGHAFHELGEPLMHPPKHIGFSPLETMDIHQRAAFEGTGQGPDSWPEMGSRMLTRIANQLTHRQDRNLTDADPWNLWIEVEPNRYRYTLDWSHGVTVRTVIWEYLATETRWEN
jgi:hypothetical protein